MSGFRPEENAFINELEDATDGVLDGACAGWDSRIYIPELGTDPFEGVDDEDLLHANAGVMAATVLAQSNQMRVLDSGIVPDKDLVRPTAQPQGKFNEFEVYTPLTPPERYSVITETGKEEVVTPTAPFYPGLSERSPGSQSAIQLKLEDETADPYRVALATGTALLQIGIEAGKDVAPVAEILNRAWGLEGAFTPGTVVGVSGTHEYSAIYAQDRNTNSRRVASWQETSYVRSGQLAMVTDDWGPNLHCDFRRARVAAESFFATAMTIETKRGGVRPTGKITYHLPSTSLLSAHPAHLFFGSAEPNLLPPQTRCPAASRLLSQVDEVGILRALWPSTEPVIAETWAASFNSTSGLAQAPVVFGGHTLTAGPLHSSSTNRLLHTVASFARGSGKTCMTALSAKVASIAEGVVDIQTVGWFSRLAAVIEIMRICNSKPARMEMIRLSWSALRGNLVRDLERSLTNPQMAALKSMIPPSLRASLPTRSSRIPLYALLWEVGSPSTKRHHTVLRGLRRGLGKAKEVAKAVTIREKVGWKASSEAEWLSTRLGVVREFWAVQYAALSQVNYVAKPLRNDLRWWVELSSAVNLFRAGVMRGISVASPGETVAVTVENVPLKLLVYHPAAHLRKTLEPQLAQHMPKFTTGDNIEDWAKQLSWHTVDYCKEQLKNMPRIGESGATSVNTHHFVRGAGLLAKEDALSDWISKTMATVADDCVALLEQRASLLAPSTAAGPTVMNARMTDALAQAAEDMAETMARVATAPPEGSEMDYIVENVNDDAWEEFLCATVDTADPAHKEAKQQHERAKRCTDRTTAEALIRWINAVFMEQEEETAAAIV